MADAPHTPINDAADKIMEGLRAEGLMDRMGKRTQTVNRLELACNAILSGEARRLAHKNKVIPNPFAGDKLNSETIHKYVKLMKWEGPVSATIRKSPAMQAYIAERRKPLKSEPKRGRGENTRRIDRIIDAIEDPSDQSFMRFEFEKARDASFRIDLAAFICKRVAGIDIKAVPRGTKWKDVLNMAGSGLSLPDQEIVRRFYRRLTDTAFLNEFDLIFEAGRVYSTYGAGSDLLFPEEIELFGRLGGVDDAQEPKST
jgi:hypothetical protein